jgi:hypothetical protein
MACVRRGGTEASRKDISETEAQASLRVTRLRLGQSEFSETLWPVRGAKSYFLIVTRLLD